MAGVCEEDDPEVDEGQRKVGPSGIDEELDVLRVEELVHVQGIELQPHESPAQRDVQLVAPVKQCGAMHPIALEKFRSGLGGHPKRPTC